jgi:hypothetical protein
VSITDTIISKDDRLNGSIAGRSTISILDRACDFPGKASFTRSNIWPVSPPRMRYGGRIFNGTHAAEIAGGSPGRVPDQRRICHNALRNYCGD